MRGLLIWALICSTLGGLPCAGTDPEPNDLWPQAVPQSQIGLAPTLTCGDITSATDADWYVWALPCDPALFVGDTSATWVVTAPGAFIRLDIMQTVFFAPIRLGTFTGFDVLVVGSVSIPSHCQFMPSVYARVSSPAPMQYAISAVFP